jgi:photosystem II stability/assembly factor-like uncharacterized protein
MLYLSTTQGIVRVDEAGRTSERIGPRQASVEALAVIGETIVAAATPDYGLPMRRPLQPIPSGGASRSSDGGATWQPVAGLAGLPVTAMAAGARTTGSPLPALFAGVDPAEVLVSNDGGQTWSAGQSLREMPGYERWSYPLPPHTPHVMAIRPHPFEPQVVFAGIEVGGIVRSDDGGLTWRLAGTEPRFAVDPDIHGLAISPAAPEVMYAATPRGVYVSEDGGERWAHRSGGLDPLYCRPIATHGDDPATSLVVATHGAGGFFGIPAERTGGSVFRTESRGRRWERVTAGLPEPLAPTPAIVADVQRANRFYLPLFSGELYLSDDAGVTWDRLVSGLPQILRATVA